MEQILIVALASLLGGLVQAVTGFGGAIVIMLFLPSILSMNAAPAVSDGITMMLSFAMLYRYRREVKWGQILFPAVCYLLVSTWVIRSSASLDGEKLKLVFGIFLILLALYFMAAPGDFRIRPSLGAGAVCAGIAGACGGLFGISGPAASLYYLAVTDTKDGYLGNLNAFFSVGVIFNMWSRVSNGFITPELLPLMAVGIVAILIGCGAGSRISQRIELAFMRKCVYILMLFAGLVTVLQAISLF